MVEEDPQIMAEQLLLVDLVGVEREMLVVRDNLQLYHPMVFPQQHKEIRVDLRVVPEVVAPVVLVFLDLPEREEMEQQLPD